MEFYNQTIKEFLDDLSSDLPAPGGGSVAGLVAALSGALNSMVYSLTIGKKKYLELNSHEQEIICIFKKESEEFTKKSLKLMEDDRKNFLELMECYKLPRNTKEETENRDKAIQAKTIKAMEAPLTLARESLKFYENLNIMYKYGNKMLLSDLSMSAILLNSAIESSIINVKVNLNYLRNVSFFEEIDNEINKIQEKSLEEKNLITDKINSIIYIN